MACRPLADQAEPLPVPPPPTHTQTWLCVVELATKHGMLDTIRSIRDHELYRMDLEPDHIQARVLGASLKAALLSNDSATVAKLVADSRMQVAPQQLLIQISQLQCDPSDALRSSTTLAVDRLPLVRQHGRGSAILATSTFHNTRRLWNAPRDVFGSAIVRPRALLAGYMVGFVWAQAVVLAISLDRLGVTASSTDSTVRLYAACLFVQSYANNEAVRFFELRQAVIDYNLRRQAGTSRSAEGIRSVEPFAMAVPVALAAGFAFSSSLLSVMLLIGLIARPVLYTAALWK